MADYDYKNINEIVEPGYTVIRLPITPVGMARFVTYIKVKNLANKRNVIEMFSLHGEDSYNIEDYYRRQQYPNYKPKKEERVFVDVIEPTGISETPTIQREKLILFSHGYDKHLVIKSENKCVVFISCYYR